MRAYLRERRHAVRSLLWSRHQKRGTPVRYGLGSGAVLLLYPDDKFSEIVFGGQFELSERTFVADYLRPGDVFLDVGANLGLYTVIAARAMGNKGQVFAFEPCEQTYNRLVQNVALNGLSNVQCVRVGLSDCDDTRLLNSSVDGFAGWNSFARPTAGQTFVQERVECVRLDSFANENDLTGKVAMIKIDVEGWELHVLDGARELLRAKDAPDLVVEFTEKNARAAGASCASVYQRLDEYGYSMYSVEGRSRCLRAEPLRQEYPYVNLIATKRPAFLAARSRFRLVPHLTGPQRGAG